MGEWTLAVLGSTTVERAGVPAAVRRRERDVLAALAVRHPAPTSASELAATIWVSPPPTAAKTLQNHIARLRRELGADAVQTVGHGYALGPGCRLDLMIVDEHAAVAAQVIAAGDDESALLHLETARRLVDGEPFADMESSAAIVEARERIGRQLLGMLDEQRACLLRNGRPADAAGVQFPGWNGPSRPIAGERTLQLLTLANYRADRRAEALRLLHAGRLQLRDAGLPLGERTQRLEQLVLADDPALLNAPIDRLIDESIHDARGHRVGLFVGRRHELQHVARWLTMRADGLGPPVLAITGPRGVGKHALARRVGLLAGLREWQVIDGDVLSPVAPGAKGRRRRVVHVLAGVDELTSLIAMGDSAVVVGPVPDEHAGSVAELPLTPMDAEDARTLARAVCGPTASADQIDRVVVHAGGLPGLVVELAAGEVGEGGSLVERLLVLLSDRSLVVAQASALEREPASVELVLAASRGAGQVDADDTDIADALAARVLVLDDTGLLTVRDDELRTALLSRLHPDLATRLHRSWIAALDAVDAPMRRSAEHAVAVAEWSQADTVRRLDETLVVERIVDVEQALRLADRLIEVAARLYGIDSHDHLSRCMHRVNLRRWVGGFEYLDDFRALLAKAVDLGDEVNVVRVIGHMASAGDLSNAGTIDAELAELLDRYILRRPQPIEAESFELRSMVATSAARATTALALADGPRCREATKVALEASNELGVPMIRMSALLSAYLGYTHPLDWRARRQLAEEAVGVAEALDSWTDRIETTHLLFSSQVQSGDPFFRSSVDRMLALIAAGPRAQTPLMEWICSYIQAASLHIEGRLDECEVALVHSYRVAPLAPDRALTTYMTQLLAVRHAQGRLAELTDQLDQLAIDQPLLRAWEAIAAWAHLQAGRRDHAVRRGRAIIDGGGLPADPAWGAGSYALARVAAASQDAGFIERMTAELHDLGGLFAWLGHGILGPFDLARAELCEAAGDRAAATVRFRAAEASCRRLHAPPFLAELDAHPLSSYAR
jgi:DNA-binding winged helix-turn-helix (wHTH) protein